MPAGDEPLLDALERYLPLDHRRRRAARGLGLGEGARAPAADLPRRRRRRRRAGARQGPRRAQGAAAAGLRRGAGRGRLRRRAVGHRADDVDLRRDRASPSCSAARATRCGASRRWSTRASSVGLGVFGSADEADARHRLGVSAGSCCSGCGPSTRWPGSTTPPSWGWPGRRTRPSPSCVDDCSRPWSRVGRRRPRAGSRRGGRSPRWPTELDAVAEERLAAVRADVLRVLDAWRQTEKRISGRAELLTLAAMQDMRAQVGRLVDRGFVAEAGPDQLRRYPTYLAAVDHRRERLDGQVARDAQLMAQVADLAGGVPAPGRRRCPRVGRPARRCAGCAGCWRSTASRCGPSTSARRTRCQRPAHPQGAGRTRPRLAAVTDHAWPPPPPADDAGRPLLRGHRGRRRPGGRRRGRRPGGDDHRARRPRTPTRRPSANGCSTSPRPRASRPSPSCGRARRPTRWPAACGGSTCCASGCTPTRSAWPTQFEAGRAARRGRVGRSPGSPTRPGPDELKTMVDQVLRGIAVSDFADVLFRAVGVRARRRHRPRRPGGAPDGGLAHADAGRPARACGPPGARPAAGVTLTRLCEVLDATAADASRLIRCAGPRQPRVPTSAAASGHAP